MSLRRNRVFCIRSVMLLVAAWCSWGLGSFADDLVVLRDGSELHGRLIAVTLDHASLEVAGGGRQLIPRRNVARIEFGETVAPVVRARVRVAEADDEVQLYLDGTPLGTPAELRAGWIDLSAKLKQGANQLTAEVINNGGQWAYRWVVEAGGDSKALSCGLPGRSGCKRAGTTGFERGTFPAGKVWVYYQQETGELKLTVEP
ncbi:MAG: hypothetical protein U0V87_14780 [Acidobacteriota bacterium]